MTRRTLLLMVVMPIALCLLPIQTIKGQSAKDMSEKSQKEVLEASEALDRAMMRKDIPEMGRHLSDDLEYTNQFGTLITKAKWLETIRTGAFNISYLKHDVVRIHVYGDSAVLLGISHAVFTLNGAKSETPRRLTRMFVKQNGEWLLVGQHVSAIEKP